MGLGCTVATAAVIVTLGLAGAMLSAACRVCSQLACAADGLLVTVKRADGLAFAPGLYRFELVPAGGRAPVTVDCEVLNAVGDATCHGDLAFVEDPEDWVIYTGGVFFLWAPYHWTDGATWDTVSVTASRDGTPLGASSFTPQFEAERINGPQCEPVCHQASATLEVSSGAP
jgi:hypothetical protein